MEGVTSTSTTHKKDTGKASRRKRKKKKKKITIVSTTVKDTTLLQTEKRRGKLPCWNKKKALSHVEKDLFKNRVKRRKMSGVHIRVMLPGLKLGRGLLIKSSGGCRGDTVKRSKKGGKY